MGVAFESGRWWEVATGSIESLAVALSLAVFATGCGKIAGLDEYSVFGGCPPGSVSEAPAQCVKVPSCGLDEVPTTGGCVRAGVPADGCGHGFEPDPERPGGCREIFPDCAEASLALLGATTCNWGTCGVLAAGAEGLFVKADAVAGGSGTRESPVRTIEEALVKARETPAAAPAIWLFPGSYAGPLVFDQPTRLYGFCLPDTIITSADASSAVIEIGPDADGSNVAGVTLRGESATAGIRVDGAEDVTLGSVVGSFPVPGSLLIDTVGGPGVLFEDMSAATSGKLDGVAIRAAMGAGVAAYGVTKLELENVRVVDTRPREADGRAVGVLVAPSVSVSVAAAAGQVNYDEVSARRSTVSISLSRIDGAAGAGIFVEGSDVTIDGTSIRRVVPDGFGRSAGLAVQRRWLGARPATLQLTRSVISDVAGSGVRLDDVDSALVEDTTIHDVESLGPGAGDAPAEPGGALGGCSGNGVRVRAFGTALSGADAGTPERGPAILERVLIQDTRESAVHVEGATAILRQSLIRDVGGCSPGLGDGIAAYGYSFAPASIAIEASRVSGVARAAVAALGADASLAGSALESCRGLIRAPDAGVSSTDRAEPSLCECDGKWSLCANRLEDLEPALVGFPECDPEKSACVRSCVTDLTSAAEGTPLQIPRWVTWLPDRDGMAFSVADDQGCATSPAPASDYRAIAARGGYTPSVGLFRGLAPGSYVAPASALVVQNAFGLQLLFFPTRELPDARNAAFVAFGVCQPPVGPFTERDELCFGHGVEGASGELLDAAGAPIGASWAIPAYFADGTAQPDPERRTVGKNAYGYFYNVPAGRYLLRVHPPAGKSMSCTLDPATGGGLGWPAQQPNTYRVEAEAGLNNFVARVFCELT